MITINQFKKKISECIWHTLEVNTCCISIGSLGDQAKRMKDGLPAGRSYVVQELGLFNFENKFNVRKSTEVFYN